MPNPVYIICSESGTEDKYTGAASHFNIIDRIIGTTKTIAENPDKGSYFRANSLSVRVVAVWRADEESDFEGNFQSELRMRLLPKNEDAILQSDLFVFLREKPKHRITIIINGVQALEAGQIVFESRIKRPEDPDWLTQSYVIDVMVDVPTAASPPSPEPENRSTV